MLGSMVGPMQIKIILFACFRVSPQQYFNCFVSNKRPFNKMPCATPSKVAVCPQRNPLSQAAAPTHLLVTVETRRVAKAFLLAFMKEVLQGQALVVNIKSTVVTAVCFQPLGGPELGEAGVTADAVNHVPIADLVLDLQTHHCCHSPDHHGPPSNPAVPPQAQSSG